MPSQPLDLIAVEIQADLDELETRMTGASRVVDAQVAKITNSVENSERAIVRSARNSGEAMEGTGRSASMLGAQFSQMGQQVAAGASPFQALAIQLPDIAYLMGSTGAEAGKLASFFGGPWGIALTTAAAVKIPLIDRLFDTADAADTARNALESLIEARRREAAEGAKLVDAERQLNDQRDRRLEIENRLDEIENKRGKSYGQERQRLRTELYSLNQQILEGEGAVKAYEQKTAPTARSEVNRSPRSSGARTSVSRASKSDLGPVQESLDDFVNKIQQEMLINLANSLDEQSDKDWDEFRKQVQRMEEFRARERERTDARLQYQQEQQIHTLAGIYQDAFRGGTQAIWKDFKEIGLRVVAEVLARFTIAKISGGGFDFGSALGTAISAAIPGFASGGSLAIGGRGGIDRNVLSLNGSPIAKVSNGEQLHVTNPSLSRGGGGARQTTQVIQVDARGAVMNDQFAAQILAQARAWDAQMGQAVGSAVLKQVPGRMANYQRDGT